MTEEQTIKEYVTLKGSLEGAMEEIILHDRVVGSLLCFSVADSLGCTVEFMKPEDIRQQYGVFRDIEGGGWLKLDPGEVTDDTQMTLCVAQSLIACQDFNLPDIANRFVDWYNTDPPDIGSTCRAGIHSFIKTGNTEAPYDIHGAGNGGVMRSLPLILLYANDRNKMLKTVVAQSRLTHNNKISDEGCCCYSDVVAAALKGADKDDLRKIVEQYPLFAADKFDGKSDAYIVDTLRTVFHYFFATESCEECIVATVNNGQDADTTGALAGGLAGAFYGKGAIPARWLDELDPSVRGELVQIAEKLAAMKESL